jgi:hypothetical protein
MTQQERVKHLLELIQENPNLPIVPMVSSEICSDDTYSTWMGSWGMANIDEYYSDEERIYFRSNYEEDLIQHLIDNDCNHTCTGMTDDELEIKATEMVNNYNWVKCLTVSIDLPE